MEGSICVGFPFIYTIKSDVPLTLTLPSGETDTEGSLLSKSAAVPPRAVSKSAALYVCLSIFLETVLAIADTSTSSSE